MREIYSTLNPSLLLCVIQRYSEFEINRTNLSPVEEYLQAASLSFNSGQKFKAHRHKECIKQILITQEAWIIISGKILFTLYDINNLPIEEIILNTGDCVITFNGGHSYEIIEDFTKVYEFKNGPYFGQDIDKEFIND